MCGYYILASKRSGTLYTGVTWGIPRRLAIFTVYESAPSDRTLSALITGTRAASLSSRFMKRAE
ncbi:hypothetical protein [Sinorhizobium prairiense]|uniref:hypothetical protein n=1 Tax=unclassified Sinorhizobium TaxID=2613772 RepID=UPI0035C93E73